MSSNPLFNPFPGLRPFGADEKHLFFGREEQTGELLQRLRQTRFLAVVGPSGSGKSSLVRAGLLPELHGGTMTSAGSYWEVVIMRPGGDPLTNLAAALVEASLYETAQPGVVDQVRTTLDRSARGLIEAVRQAGVDARTNTLVVVDQFEEIFRFREQGGQSTEEAAAFVKLLLEASHQTSPAVYIVITMRSDYLGDCAQFRGLAQAVNEGEYLIPRLTRAQKRSAITGPIQVGGAEISKRLLTKLLNDVGDDPDQLPVLQHALMRTWDCWAGAHEPKEAIDLRHYEATGGMQEALSRHADEVYASLPGDRLREVAGRVFRALTEKVDDHRGIRRPMRVQQLAQVAGASEEEVCAVVEAFRKKGCTFLMPPEAVVLEPKTIIDISHESLMRIWQRLRRWVDEEAQSAGIYRRLVETAHLHARGKAGLYHDPDLSIAQGWRQESDPNPGWAELYGGDFDTALAFLDRSQEEAEREVREREASRQRELAQAKALAASQSRAARLLRRFAATVAVALVVAIGLSIWAFKLKDVAEAQSTRARLQAEEAQRAKARAQLQQGKTSLALAAAAQADRRHFESRLLAARALGFERFGRTNLPTTVQTEFPVLLEPATEDWTRAGELARGDRPVAPAWVSPVLRQHPDAISTVAVHPNGRLAASSSEATTSIYIWDLESGQRIRSLGGHSQDVEALAFSRDGSLLASAGDRGDNAVILWNTTTWEEAQRIPLNAEGPHSLTFTPDGQRLLAGDEEGRLFRITIVNGEIEEFPDLHGARFIYDIAYSRDGSKLVISNGGGDILLHDPATLRVRDSFRLGPPNRAVPVFLALSPDGKWLAACSRQSGASIWDLTSTPPTRTADLLAILPEATTQIRFDAAAISFDGARLVLSGNDRQWLGSEEAATPLRPTLSVFDVSNPHQPRHLHDHHGHASFIRALAAVPHSRRFFSGDEEGLLLVREADTAPADLPLPLGHVVNPSSLAVSPDGRWFLSADASGAVLLWNAASGRLQASLPHRDRCRDAVFSADSRTLFTCDHRANALYAWDVQTGQLKHTLESSSRIESLSINPTGDTLVMGGASSSFSFFTIGEDGTLTPAGSVRASHRCHYVRFLADGTRLIAAAFGGNISLFGRNEAGTWRVIDSIPGTQSDRLSKLAVHPTAPRFVTSSWDGWVKLWEVLEGRIIEMPATFRELDSQVTSVQFSPDGSRLLTADVGGAKLWDLGTGQLLNRFPAPARTREALFMPDDAYALLAHQDGSLHLWFLGRDPVVESWPNLAGQPANLQENNSPSAGPFGLAFLDGGDSLAIGGGFPDEPSAVKIWDFKQHTFTRTFVGVSDMITQTKPSPDGELLAVASVGSGISGSLCLWPLGTNTSSQPQPLCLTNGLGTFLLAWHPAGNLLVANHGDGGVRLWQRSPEGAWGPGDPGLVTSAGAYYLRSTAFTPDGERLIIGGRNEIAIYPVDRRSYQLGRPQTLRYPWAVCVSILAQGSVLAAASPATYDLRFWHLDSLKPVGRPITFGFRPLRIQASPDGRLLALSGTQGRLVVLDVSDPTSPVIVLEQARGGPGIFRDLAFSPDSSMLACSFEGDNGFVSVFRVGTAQADLSGYLRLFQFEETSVEWNRLDNGSLTNPTPALVPAPLEHSYLSFLGKGEDANSRLFGRYLEQNQLRAALAVLASRPDNAPAQEEVIALAGRLMSKLRRGDSSTFAPDQLTGLLERVRLPPELKLEFEILNDRWDAALKTVLQAAVEQPAGDRLATHFFKSLDAAMGGSSSRARRNVPASFRAATLFRSTLERTLERWEPDSLLPVVPSNDAGAEDSALHLELIRQSVRPLVHKGASWHYFPDDAPAPIGWREPGFDDSAWPQGPADLGFGGTSDREVLKTLLTRYPGRITYYFRHRFVLDELPEGAVLQANLQRDDGAVLYLNGVEVLRDNLPSGPLDDTTRASSSVGNEAESTFYLHTIPGQPLVIGTNELAVEVHQSSPTSSDVHFDLALYPKAEPSTNAIGGLAILKEIAGARLSAPWAGFLPALTAEDPSSVPSPLEPLSWVAHSLGNRFRGDPAAEVEALGRAAGLLESSPQREDWRRYREILQRMERLLVDMGRASEGDALRAKVFAPPSRPGDCPPSQLDLTLLYNASLYDARAWMSERWGGLVLKTALGSLAAADNGSFDVRGIVQLNSGVYQTDNLNNSEWIGHSLNSLAGLDYPDRVDGIPVGRKCHAITFLTGVLHNRMTPGTEVGQFIFRYADGSSEVLPLRFQENIQSFWGRGARGDIAWTGPIPGSPNDHQISRTTWRNPHPDRAVTSFDFVSSKAQGSPFLLAATTE